MELNRCEQKKSEESKMLHSRRATECGRGQEKRQQIPLLFICDTHSHAS